MVEKVKRSYRSELRGSQAAATRRAVLTAARDLFLEQGYGATTVEQVAKRAGVSKPTVFTSVGNKQELLKEVRDVAMAGDDRPLPLAERNSVQRARDAATQYEALQHLAAHIAALTARYAPVHELLQGAAASGEPELRELSALAEQQRHRGAEIFVAILHDKGRLRPGRTLAVAADLLDLYMNPSQYTHLVTHRGWSLTRYQNWLADTLATQLLPATALSRGSRTSG